MIMTLDARIFILSAIPGNEKGDLRSKQLQNKGLFSSIRLWFYHTLTD